MSVRPLLWLLFAGCSFDSFGLGSAGLDPGSESTAGDTALPTSASSDEPAMTTGETGTTAASTTAASTTEASEDTSSGDTAVACADGCPPRVEWSVVMARTGHAVALDPGGDVLVAGEQPQIGDDMQRDIWVARHAGEDGALRWEQRHAGAEGKADVARAVVVLDDGRIVVGGFSQEILGQRQDVWVGWFAADGDPLSGGNLGTAHWDGANVKLDESVRALALDAKGELLLGGTRCLSPCEVPDAWIARFSREGVSPWSEPMLVCGPGMVRAVAPLAGGLLAAGTDGHTKATVPWRTHIRGFDPEGAGTWSALQEPPGDTGFDALAVGVAPNGDLWVIGRELEGVVANGSFIRLYRPDRAFVPVLERRGAALDGEAQALAVAADGSIVVTGAAGPAGARHLWLGRFDAELEPVWRIDEPAQTVRGGRGVAQDERGVVVLGELNGPADSPASSWLTRYVHQP